MSNALVLDSLEIRRFRCFREPRIGRLGRVNLNDPGTPLGQAITKRYFDPEGQPVQTLLAWMARLFA